MKLKIEVDLNDFYAENFESDYELGTQPTCSLSEEVVQVIKYEVNSAISKQIKDVVVDSANKAFIEFGHKKIEDITSFKMNEFIESGMVRSSGASPDLISIEEKLRQIFDQSNGWRDPYSAMQKVGEKFSKECRERYDMAFASNIVTGLEKQGLLKAGAFESITKEV